MFDVLRVTMYTMRSMDDDVETIEGRIVRKDNFGKATFIPHGKGNADCFTVSGQEGVSHNGFVWYIHGCSKSDIVDAIREEFKRKYVESKNDAKYYYNQYLNFGGDEEEADAE